MAPSLVYFASAALCISALVWIRARNKHTAPLPPGPPAEFLIGHARIFPREEPQQKLAEWARQYGIYSLEFNLVTLIVFRGCYAPQCSREAPHRTEQPDSDIRLVG